MSSVSADYGHIRKVVAAAPPLTLPSGSQLKWYDVHREQARIPDEIRQEAAGFLCAEEESGRLAIAGELGFVVLHLAGPVFLLLVCTWRYDNELWESIYCKEAGGFEPLPMDEPHKGTFCVWEMGAVVHEQQAWIRYLVSARDAAARQAYLADQPTSVLV